MFAIKRVTTLFIELVAEVLLLGFLLGALISGQIEFLHGFFGSVIALPVVLFLHGYYLTRALLGVIWRSQTFGIYPAVAAMLFIVHTHFAYIRLEPDMSPIARAIEPPFLAGGACAVFASALAGNWLLQQWTQGPDKKVYGDLGQ